MGTIIRTLRGRIARHIYVVAGVVLALLLRVALAEQSITLPTYITFYPVVILAALLGGMWTGILATALSALLADYFLLEPVGQFTIHSISDVVGLIIFFIAGVSVSIVTGLYHRSREKLAAYEMEAAVLSERREMEESRARAEKSLRESQAKLASAMESMTDSVIITDVEGRFVDFNDAFATFYRFKSKAECAQSFDEFASLFEVFLANGEPAPREMYVIQRALRGETGTSEEYILRRRDTGETWIGSLSFGPIRDKDGAIIGSVVTSREITEAKRVEEERQISIDFLAMVNQSEGTKDLLQRATAFFQQRSGCEAVGIRLREGEDYPYSEARGFSEEFVQVESRLCARAATGKVLKDNAGNAVLECLCGNVIRGCVEVSKPFYTEHGSFWSNSTTDLIASAKDGDLPASARNRCNREGYESVGLFPIYVGEERFGLLQLADRHKGRFSAQNIILWERWRGIWPRRFRSSEPRRRCEPVKRNSVPSPMRFPNCAGWLTPTDGYSGTTGAGMSTQA